MRPVKISLLLLILALLCVSSFADRPSSHKIKNVPYHKQLYSYDCGEASLEMVLSFSGPDIDQRAIIDVTRASDVEGTLSYDMIRAGHFSEMSKAAMTTLFPDQAPRGGWMPNRPYGLASFGYPRPPVDDQTKIINSTCWISQLKDIIAQDIPVVTLMQFDPPAHPEGHYRVAIGYDEQTITFLDPWNRANGSSPQTPRVVTYTDDQACELWTHREGNGNVTYPPFFAVMMTPWKIDVFFEWNEDGSNLMTLTANVEYPCYPPFCYRLISSPDQYDALYSQAIVNLPPHMRVVGGSDQVSLGTVQPGETIQTKWQIQVDDTVNKTGVQEYITVNAFGEVQAAVPYMEWSPGYYIPGYSYTDVIGGYTSIPY